MNRIRWFLRDIAEYCFSIQTAFVLIVQYIIMDYYGREITSFSLEAGCKVTPWILPFLNANLVYSIISGITIVYFFSTVPFLQYKEMYVVLRQGRSNWLMSKIVRIIISSAFLTIMIALCSMLICAKNLSFSLDWGDVYNTIALTNAGSEYNITLEIPYQIVAEYEPIEAMFMNCVSMFLEMVIIGMVMFTLALCLSKTVSVAFGTFACLIALALENMRMTNTYMRIFAIDQWAYLVNFEDVFGTNGMLTLLFVTLLLVIVCTVIMLIRIRKIDFNFAI